MERTAYSKPIKNTSVQKATLTAHVRCSHAVPESLQRVLNISKKVGLSPDLQAIFVSVRSLELVLRNLWRDEMRRLSLAAQLLTLLCCIPWRVWCGWAVLPALMVTGVWKQESVRTYVGDNMNIEWILEEMHDWEDIFEVFQVGRATHSHSFTPGQWQPRVSSHSSHTTSSKGPVRHSRAHRRGTDPHTLYATCCKPHTWLHKILQHTLFKPLNASLTSREPPPSSSRAGSPAASPLTPLIPGSFYLPPAPGRARARRPHRLTRGAALRCAPPSRAEPRGPAPAAAAVPIPAPRLRHEPRVRAEEEGKGRGKWRPPPRLSASAPGGRVAPGSLLPSALGGLRGWRKKMSQNASCCVNGCPPRAVFTIQSLLPSTRMCLWWQWCCVSAQRWVYCRFGCPQLSWIIKCFGPSSP